MSPVVRSVRTALAQWPPLAVAWSVHALLLLYLFWSSVPADAPAGVHFAMVGGVLCLVAVEIGLLAVVGLALELGLVWVPRKLPVDLVKSLVVAGTLGLLSASVLKFAATSVHLRTSDLWFAWTNFRQILEEATIADAAGLLVVPAGILLIAGGLLAGLRHCRRRDPHPTTSRLLAVPPVAAIALAALYFGSPPLRLFADSFVPEIFWARAALDRPNYLDPRQAAALPDDPALGPAILPYRPRAAGRPWNVVLVMIESVPHSRTAFGGGPAGVTPNLEALAAESVVFSRAYTTSTHSDYAQMSILSSLHPRKYDHHDYYLRIEYPRTMLWDALSEAGYLTAMFSCQNERWGNMLNYLDTPGLDVLRHSLHWPREPHRGRGAESKVYEETPVAAWERWRAAHPAEPAFTYLNFQSNHFPYELPPGEPRPFAPFALDFSASFLRYPRDKVPVMLNRFHNALAYADRMIGRIVAFLERRGEWDRTVLVVVSDHGEAFYEHEMPTHGTSLFEEQVRSLWLMRVPGEPARRIEQPVSLLDLPPTLLEILRLPPHGNFQGRGDILQPDYDGGGRPFPFTIQGLTFEDGLLLDDWKYIVNWDRRTRRLFDLAADPGETTDLFDRETERARALEAELGRLMRRQLAYYRDQGWRQGRYPPRLP